MPNYRRYSSTSQIYFFTLVTYQRQPVLLTPEFRSALRSAIAETLKRYPFSIDGWVLLPDHLHCIWTLPDRDADFSRRWSIIKRLTTQKLKDSSAVRTAPLTASRGGRREGSIWQRRFWEHEIGGDEDFQHHLDYCYWNPVKHGLVHSPAHWPYSTFHRDVRRGLYPETWGSQVVEREDWDYGE